MKLTQRLFALALVLCMLACLCVSVFAYKKDETTGKFDDESSITIKKIYKVTNAGTTAPAETFELEIKNSGKPFEVTDSTLTMETAPALSTEQKIEAVFNNGSTATDDTNSVNFTVSLPTYTQVGVYKYKLAEKDGGTAGTTYQTRDITLVVTVIEQDGKVRVASVHTEEPSGTKSGDVTNTFSAGSLAVKKNVTGALGDRNYEFKVDVTFTAPEGDTVRSNITYEEDGATKTIAPSDWTNGTASVTIQLKDAETITFNNIPYGVSYQIAEKDYTGTTGTDGVYGYTTTYTGITADADGKYIATISGPSANVEITNNKGGEPDMGVSLDSLPYILALVLACGGAVVLFTRKRHIEE